MRLSILIVNWNTKEKLDACLASLAAHAPTDEWEAIVVDNNSSDGSAFMVENSHPWARIVQTGANTGYAAGNNMAFSLASGEFLLTLNPDTEFRDDTLQRAMDELARRPGVGALSVKLILPDGSTQRSVRGFPSLAGLVGAVLKLDRAMPRSPLGSYTLPLFDHESSGPAPQPMGTFLLFRREALAAIGSPRKPFDESFPIFFNEVDLLKRLADAGWPAWHFAGGSCLHHHGSSTRQVKKAMVWESHYSLLKYLRRHVKGPGRIILPLVAVLSYAAALLRAKGVHGGFRPEHHNLQLEHPG